ncbi:MAG: NADPH-dependent FMN reductase [Geminicoccaceae bacterium]
MAEALHTLIVYGSVRQDRQGIGLARFLGRHIDARGGTSELADPLELQLPLLDRMYKEYAAGEAPEAMQRMASMIARADAVLIVSAEYNHGIPPALKNLLDHFLEEWLWRPAGIACYSAGRFGGVRAAMQLRMTLGELGMPTISSLLPVPEIGKTVALDGTVQQDWLPSATDRFLDELFWWAEAARTQKRAQGVPF